MGSGAWPNGVELRNNQRVMVTGGAGFLGRHVVAKLREHGATQIEVVDRDRYDLRQLADIRRALNECKPDLIIHLAARVGGIGANREHPAEFCYDNPLAGSGQALAARRDQYQRPDGDHRLPVRLHGARCVGHLEA